MHASEFVLIGWAWTLVGQPVISSNKKLTWPVIKRSIAPPYLFIYLFIYLSFITNKDMGEKWLTLIRMYMQKYMCTIGIVHDIDTEERFHTIF